jgi:hypothetical protein
MLLKDSDHDKAGKDLQNKTMNDDDDLGRIYLAS